MWGVLWGKGQAYEDFRPRKEHVKAPGVKVSGTLKEVKGRPPCLEHREVGVQG